VESERSEWYVHDANGRDMLPKEINNLVQRGIWKGTQEMTGMT
jgi:hypothetical protein